MYYNMSVEELAVAKSLTELDIKNRELAATLYPQIEEIIKKFDDKILNRRLETALKKDDARLYTERNDNSYKIKFYCDDDMVKGVNCWEYSKNREIILAWCNTYNNSYQKGFLSEEKIKADELIKMIEKDRVSFIEETEKIKAELSTIDSKIAEYEDLIKRCDAFNRSLGGTIKDYYGIKDINNY